MLKTIRFIAILGNVVVLCAAYYAFTLQVRSSSNTVQLLVISGFLILSITNVIVITEYSKIAYRWTNLFHKPELLKPSKDSIRPLPPRDWEEVKKEMLDNKS